MSAKGRKKGGSRGGPAVGKSPTKGRGRPAKVTAAIVEQIGELMAIGVPEEYACELHGINPETFGPAVSRRPEFKRIMRVHHARFMAESLTLIKEGGEKIMILSGEDKDGKPIYSEKILPWTGRAWILERRYKPHFNRTEVHKPGEGRNESGGLMTEAEMADLSRISRALEHELTKTATADKR